MSEDVKKLRKIARAVQTMLEMEGRKVTVNKVVEMIEGQDLVDVVKLKDKVLEELPVEESASQPSVRMQEIEEFLAEHWGTIRDNDAVKNALLHAYTMGRHKKEARREMAAGLIARCEVSSVEA